MSGAQIPPVAMIHGWGGSFETTWEEPGIAQLIREIGRQVLPVDLLGHGNAEKPHEPDAYTDLTPGLFAALGDYKQVDAVGFSMGAMTLLDAIQKRPERFRSIILLGIGDAIFEEPDMEYRERISKAILGTGDQGDKAAAQFGTYARQPGNDLQALHAAFMRPNRSVYDPKNFGHFTGRVLVVIGDQDSGYPAERLTASFPNASMEILKGVDHFASTESFKFIDSLLNFLESD